MHLPNLIASLAIAAALAAQPYVVVGAAGLRAAAAPLLAARKADGLAPRFVELTPELAADADALAARLRAVLAESTQPGYLLLLGDSDQGKAPLPSLARPGLPQLLPGMPGKSRVWSDLGYVDLAGNGAPGWAIGRIPVRDAEQLAIVVAKILAYERTPPEAWVHELALVAGDGNFGAVVDTVLAGALRQLFAEELAPGFALSALVALPDSPYFVAPERFGAEVLARLDRGPFVAIYAGHGSIDRFADLRLRERKETWPILRREDVVRLEHAERTILLAWACHIGEFPRESLGEVLLRAPHGPVAVVAASEVSFPFGDLLLGRELMKAAERTELRRLGDLVRVARERMLAPVAKDPFVKRAGTVAGLLGIDAEKQAALRRYTADLYHLLGDPALVLPRRGKLDVVLEGAASLAEPLVVKVLLPPEAAITKVTLELCRDRGTGPDEVVQKVVLPCVGEVMRATLAWPKGMTKGMAIVRVAETSERGHWFGGLRFRVGD